MKYLFTAEGERALASFLARPALLAFDFDGTLAPIVALPKDAQLPTANRQLLLSLCTLAPVAIISGRSVADLEARLGFEPKYLVGNHGVEGIPANDALLAGCRRTCTAWHQQMQAWLATEPLATGVALEDKTYSLSLHYRLSADPQRSARWLRERLERLQPPPHIIPGKHVFNLMPPRSSNKRQALQSLLAHEQLEQAFFIGDDDTDETIFNNAPAAWLTVRVEASAASGARFFLQAQQETQTLLERMLAHLQKPKLP